MIALIFSNLLNNSLVSNQISIPLFPLLNPFFHFEPSVLKFFHILPFFHCCFFPAFLFSSLSNDSPSLFMWSFLYCLTSVLLTLLLPFIYFTFPLSFPPSFSTFHSLFLSFLPSSLPSFPCREEVEAAYLTQFIHSSLIVSSPEEV